MKLITTYLSIAVFVALTGVLDLGCDGVVPLVGPERCARGAEGGRLGNVEDTFAASLAAPFDVAARGALGAAGLSGIGAFAVGCVGRGLA